MKKIFFLTLLLIGVFFSFYRVKPVAIYSYQKKEEKTAQPVLLPTQTKEKSIFDNEHVVGHLTSSSGIDTLIVQGNNNTYYLQHDLNGKETKEGQAFLDYRAKIDESYQLNIYGHHFKERTGIFASLTNYTDISFYKQNPYFYLETRKRKVTYLVYNVLGVFKDNNEHMKLTFSSRKAFLEHLTLMNQSSLYDTGVSVNENDKILVLQTCYYDRKVGDYLLILMKEVKSEIL